MAPPENQLPGAWLVLPTKCAQGLAQTRVAVKAGPGRSAALSPVTCMKGQLPQHLSSPRCHLDMGVHSLGPNTAHATSIQHPENVSGWKSLQIQCVSLKMTKLPAFLSSLRGMQAKEKRSPICCFKQ